MRLATAAVAVVVGAAPDMAAADKRGDTEIAVALAAAVPAAGATDVVLIEQPWAPRAPHVRAATPVAAPPASVKAVLLDPGHYRAIIPGLIRADVERSATGAITVAWELEVPLFNLEGRLTMRERPDGIELDLFEGDLSPGRIVFSIVPRPGGSTLVVDAQLDVANSTWLLRRIMARSPAGEPAALAASSYVALRAVALRAQRVNEARAWRPGAPMAPPPTWLPDPRPLATPVLAPLRARGVVGLVARTATERLGGVAVVVVIGQPVATVATRLHDPQSWRAFPGWRTVRNRPGPHGAGADVEENLPLVDLDATWAAEPGPLPRWTASEGVTRGARLGWGIFPGGSSTETLAALVLYPRLELTGRLARRSIASEPLLEQGMAIALAFANATAMKAALETPGPR